MIVYTDSDKNLIEEYSNKRFWDLKGTLSETQAKFFLDDFLRNNIDFTVELLFGLKIFPFQSFILSNWLNKSFCINIWSRGGSKTWVSAMFCALYAVFNPDKRIVLTSASFRSSRAVLGQVEKFINADGAELLKQCFPYDVRKSTDLWELPLAGDGFIKAVPLNEKIRGHRADVLFCDEGLLINRVLMEGTIQPFLLSKDTVQEQLEIMEQEDFLIKKGVMNEDDRIILESTKKMIILSSASFEFEYLYEIYKDWLSKSLEKNSKYFVSRLSYASLPKELVEEDIVKEAESKGITSSFFQKEYMARFPSASDGYFNLQQMNDCTILDGDYPCIQIVGDKDSEYILSIDPSFSSSKSSDYFAMGLFLIDKTNKTLYLVNSYGVAGGRLSQHIDYVSYLIENFNIVLIAADLLGGMASNFNFLESANLSTIFKEKGLELRAFEGDFNENDYDAQIKMMRKTYDKNNLTICYRQKFTSQWIREANEYLQHFIQAKRLFFCSRIIPNEREFNRFEKFKLPFEMENAAGKRMSITEFCEEQDILIDETKNQIALITPRTNPNGSMAFDLPPEVRAIKGENRSRKDNYTTTLIAVWAFRFYMDFLDENVGKVESWRPFFLN